VRLATWNVNSALSRLPRLLPWLDQRAPDIVCLQETKLSDDAFAESLDGPLTERGYVYAHVGEGRWNGVALLSGSTTCSAPCRAPPRSRGRSRPVR